MKNIQRLASLLIIILLSACSRPDPDLATIFQSINEDALNNSGAYETLEDAIFTIGHRLTGTENGRRAEEYAYNLFREYGLDTEYFEFETETWMRDSVLLHVLIGEKNPVQLDLDVVSLAHSPLSADVSAPIIDLGSGLKKDFEKQGNAIQGKIILVNIGLLPEDTIHKNLHRSEKTALAIEYGAIGAIFINRVPGRVLLTGTASVTGELITIPAVCISYEDGEMMRERLAQGTVRAKIQMTNFSKKVTPRNVIATLKGSELPDEIIIIGGHLDSWDLATGAIDNGIGTFAIIDIARAFSALKLNPKRTIQFVMFMGEEQGLLGSKAWVEHLKQTGELEKIRYYINLDMAGNPVGFNIMSRDEMKDFFTQTGTLIQQTDATFTNEIISNPELHSDHQVFMLEGIPIMEPVSNLAPVVYDFYHSNGDHFNLVDRPHLVNTVRFMGMILYALADAGEIQARKFNSEETRDFLMEAGLKEELILGREWKWEVVQ